MIKILVVDDEECVRTPLQRYLSRKNYCVEIALNGEEALAKCKNERYHVILSDHTMPGIAGMELFRKLKEISPDSKLIVMSGHRLPGWGGKMEKVPCLQKPMSLKAAHSLIEKAIKAK